MRKIGTLTSAAQARRLHRYLIKQGIDNTIDERPDAADIWVLDEDRVDAGREVFADFQTDPMAERFDAPEPVIFIERTEPSRKPQRRSRFRVSAPVTMSLIVISVVVTLVTNFGRTNEGLLDYLFLTLMKKPSGAWIGLPEIREHFEIWRLYTPIFVHLNELHLLFNMYMLWVMGNFIEQNRGSRTMLVLVLVIAPFSNIVQHISADALFGGMSGVLYGLFGYMWARAWLLPNDGLVMPEGIFIPMMIWLVLCMTPLIEHVANGAHIGGLIAGFIWGALPRLWR